MLRILGNMNNGYNEICNTDHLHQDMLMDVGVQVLDDGQTFELFEEAKEAALLLLSGKVTMSWDNQRAQAERRSLFDENPTVLHVPKSAKVSVTADGGGAELLIQKTVNAKTFTPKLYNPSDIATDILGENVWNDTAKRLIRTVFDYTNAPYSNMVLGEVINFPGRWSSYIPHGHEQPEVYFYRFDKDSGFGAAFIGDDAYKIRHNSALIIPGGPTHPQASAPGYAMYYCWMIRHLDNNPWTARVNDERFTWLLEKDVSIWPD